MKNTVNFLLAIICSLLLTSCQKGFVCMVFNNTGQDIVVSSYDTVMNAKEYLIKSGAAVDIANPTALKVKRPLGSAEWNYVPVPVSKNYWYSRSSFGKTDVRFQIQSDGLIYVLSPGTEKISSALPNQPEGFPLKPQPTK